MKRYRAYDRYANPATFRISGLRTLGPTDEKAAMTGAGLTPTIVVAFEMKPEGGDLDTSTN